MSDIVKEISSLIDNKLRESIEELRRNIKVYDHMEALKKLENSRKALDKVVGDFNEKKETFDDDVKRFKNTVEEQMRKSANIERQISDLLPHVITIIGIFVTILIVFFGGISIISNLEVIKATFTSPPAFAFALALSAFAIFGFLMLFVYLIGRLSSRTINVDCTKYKDVDKTCRDYMEKHVATDNAGDLNDTAINQARINELIALRKKCFYCIYAKRKNYDNIDEDDREKYKIPKKTCKFLNRLIHRYPYIFWIGVAFLLVISGTIIWMLSY